MVTEEMIAAGWIEHDGGACPVPNRGTVEVLLRDGTVSFSRFGFWIWRPGSDINIDIVGYRPRAAAEIQEAA